MRNVALVFVLGILVLGSCASTEQEDTPKDTAVKRSGKMELGAFSVSLAVKDIQASREFYEKLGFEQIAGEQAQNWLVLQNGTTTIGLFQGMFPNNIMTFNPGWTHNVRDLKEFKDVRDIQKTLKAAGITPVTAADENSTGPANFVIVDPDGNSILFDQHVAKPGSDD